MVGVVGIGMGALTELRVDVEMREVLASLMALTQSRTSCAVSA